MKKNLVRAALAALVLLVALVSCGKPQQEITIRIPLVTWGGYAALFAANGGPDATTESLFYKYGKFKVQLVQEENPANQLQGFATGMYPIIWSTLDMVPLSYDSLAGDKRTIPVVLGLFDYSAGGDGIITRGSLASTADLRGKKVVTAQFTPSHYFLLWTLEQAGLGQKDLSMVFVADAIAAKDSYIADRSIDACVTWSPFIYDITDNSKPSYIPGSTLFTTTEQGNPSYGTIADVYLARADFVAEHPEMAQAFCKAMLEGEQRFRKDVRTVAAQIAAFFGIKGGVEEVMLMFDDVVIAGAAENREFFGAQPGTGNAAAILAKAIGLYQANGGALPAGLALDPAQVAGGESMRKALAEFPAAR